MGVTKQAFNLLSDIINNMNDINEKNYIEIGIQNFSGPQFRYQFLRDEICGYFRNCISLDLHNVKDVTICDLSVYHENLYNADLMTNFGTSEHVEYEEGQYNCWKNMHNWLNINGIIIHEIPEIGSWKNHCRYYTDFDFFKNFTTIGYEILELNNHSDENGNLNWCVMKKIEDKEFINYDEFYKFMKIDYDVKFSDIHINNNPKKLS